MAGIGQKQRHETSITLERVRCFVRTRTGAFEPGIAVSDEKDHPSSRYILPLVCVVNKGSALRDYHTRLYEKHCL